MTEWTDFSITDIVKHGCTLLGNKADRQNTVEYLLSRWDTDGEGTLIVLDSDGTFYEKYGGNAILVDLESAHSVLLFASINRLKGKDTGNIVLDAVAEHDYLQHLMNELITCAASAAERWDTEKGSAWKSNRKLLPVFTE